jgi:hypothetical protein
MQDRTLQAHRFLLQRTAGSYMGWMARTPMEDEARPHQGRWCFGKTPMRTFLDAMPMTKEKMIAA